MYDEKDKSVYGRDVTLWMLNDYLEDEELTRQLHGFAEAGYGTVITRTFDGLRTPYLSDEFMQRMHTIICVAEECGVQVWLQAGYMPNGIPDLPERYEAKVISCVAEPLDTDCVVQRLDDGKVLVQRRRAHELDVLSPEACQFYIERAYQDCWCESFSSYFGNVISGVWVDEPCLPAPDLPWSDVLHDNYREMWSEELCDRVTDLFIESGRSFQTRYRYWRAVQRSLLSAYFKIVSEWCSSYNIAFCGHLMGEDTVSTQIAFTAGCMAAYQYMHIPGIDHLTEDMTWTPGSYEENTKRQFILTPKQCSSAAHQLGHNRVLAEIYGVSTQNLGLPEQQRIGEHFSMLGITQRCVHGAFYSMAGRRKRIYVPHLSHQQPWWKHARHITDHFSTLHQDLQSGTYQADVLVLHPLETGFGLFDVHKWSKDCTSQANERLWQLDQTLAELSENLLTLHRGFEYGDEQVMENVGAGVVSEDGRPFLCIGRMRYSVVVLPQIQTIREQTLDLLLNFIGAGGLVLTIGRPPILLEGRASTHLLPLAAACRSCYNTKESLRGALAAIPSAIEVQGDEAESVWVHGRVKNNDIVHYCRNMTNRFLTLHALVDGERYPLSLEPWEMKEVCAPRVPLQEKKMDRLSNTWQMQRSDYNVFPLDCCCLQCGTDVYSELVPVASLGQILSEDNPYNGPISLRFSVQIEVVPSDCFLVLEEADLWTIKVNGQPVAYAGLAAWRDASFLPVDVRYLLVVGYNSIVIDRTYQSPDKLPFAHASRFFIQKGTEIEMPFLLGDFAVSTQLSEKTELERCIRLHPDMSLIAEPLTAVGQMLDDGYPFYVGTVVYSQEYIQEENSIDHTTELVVHGVAASSVEVLVNDESCGVCIAAPYHFCIGTVLRPGINSIQIVLTNTLRNLFGPHHRSLGEPMHCWGPVTWSGRWAAHTGQGYEQWYSTRGKDTDAWTDDYNVVSFGFDCVEIVRSFLGPEAL